MTSWATVGGLAALAVFAATRLDAAAASTIANVDLGKPFAARSDWRLIGMQGPAITDPIMGDGTIPGSVTLCLTKTTPAQCAPLQDMPAVQPGVSGLFSDAHYLVDPQIVYPRGPSAAPLLLLQTASMHSGDGDQVVYTQLLAYQRAADRFAAIYQHSTGHNNNQEVRIVMAGPLMGDVIAVEPTQDKPYGFWVTVSQLTPAYTYRQVLRYRSATGYGDRNPLAVIDSEMPNIEAHLGAWKPGAPLPAPAKCAHPHLVKLELWCN
jgi:hypothetical protein